MYAHSPAVIDPALTALMAVAKQVTPSGQPTVAAQVAEAAQQQAQPPQGIAGALQQSQQAAPSVAQNMQEQQAAQMAQSAQQAPQPPQMMAEGGIAGLPITVGEFAEGGVIGYAFGGLEDSEDASNSFAALSKSPDTYNAPEQATSVAGDAARRAMSGVGNIADQLAQWSDKRQEHNKEYYAQQALLAQLIKEKEHFIIRY